MRFFMLKVGVVTATAAATAYAVQEDEKHLKQKEKEYDRLGLKHHRVERFYPGTYAHWRTEVQVVDKERKPPMLR